MYCIQWLLLTTNMIIYCAFFSLNNSQTWTFHLCGKSNSNLKVNLNIVCLLCVVCGSSMLYVFPSKPTKYKASSSGLSLQL